jgi:hypothetical protein
MRFRTRINLFLKAKAEAEAEAEAETQQHQHQHHQQVVFVRVAHISRRCWSTMLSLTFMIALFSPCEARQDALCRCYSESALQAQVNQVASNYIGRMFRSLASAMARRGHDPRGQSL